jgi:GNAT superfamily N-acetyltransferase
MSAGAASLSPLGHNGGMRVATADLELDVLPANEASWADVQAVFGMRGQAASCRCQWFKLGWHDLHDTMPVEERIERQRYQTACGQPDAPSTSGLLGYLDGEPVGWCAVEPRSAYPTLSEQRVVLTKRGEDRADESVWSVTCFVTRVGFRHRGVMRTMARAAVEHARGRGVRSLEAYPIVTDPGVDIPWGEAHVGALDVLLDAGFTEVAHPTKRRYVVRMDFEPAR